MILRMLYAIRIEQAEVFSLTYGYHRLLRLVGGPRPLLDPHVVPLPLTPAGAAAAGPHLSHLPYSLMSPQLFWALR
jgi:hypothetical protein